jgi:hypothetical protein
MLGSVAIAWPNSRHSANRAASAIPIRNAHSMWADRTSMTAVPELFCSVTKVGTKELSCRRAISVKPSRDA